MSEVKDISFVIIGRNAEWSIARLLDSVLRYTPPQVTSEIIYVDSASTDHTLQIVSHYPARIVNLRSDARLCASAGRFVGSQYATGRYLVFLDSDMELLRGWLVQAIRVLERYSEIAIVSGIQVDIEAGRVEEHGSDGCDSGGEGEVTEVRFAGSAAMFRREVLNCAGTWNPFIVSDEEPELCLRIRRAGYQIVRVECPAVRHFGYAPPTLSALWSRRRRRLFLGYGQVIRYHLHTGLLLTYLKERGWVVMPALVMLSAIVAFLVSCATGNALWLACFFCVLLLIVAADALRSRSVYRAIFHVLHRALILEGTVRGFAGRCYSPGDYPYEAQRADANASSIDPVVSAQNGA